MTHGDEATKGAECCACQGTYRLGPEALIATGKGACVDAV